MLHISQTDRVALPTYRPVYVFPSPYTIQRLRLGGDLNAVCFFQALDNCSQTLEILVLEGHFRYHAGDEGLGYDLAPDFPSL